MEQIETKKKAGCLWRLARAVLISFAAFIVLGLIVGASSKDKHEPAEVRASRPEPTAEERAANKAAADAARALLPKPAPTPAPTPKPTPKPTPTPEPQREIKWREISEIYSLGTTTTELKNNEIWKGYQGKTVEWSGYVAEVTKGLFGGVSVLVKINKNTFTGDVLIELESSETSKALELSKGDPIKFSAKLKNWGTLIPMTADEGILK